MKLMYVLVRKELDETYRCIQGAHALAQYVMIFPQEAAEWKNEHLIFLGTKFQFGIDECARSLIHIGIKYQIFREPTFGQSTALACYCESEIFKNFDLA